MIPTGETIVHACEDWNFLSDGRTERRRFAGKVKIAEENPVLGFWGVDAVFLIFASNGEKMLCNDGGGAFYSPPAGFQEPP